MVRSQQFTLSLVCVVLLTSAVAPARADNTYWQHDPATPGDWFAPANWTVGVPDSAIHDYTYIINGGTASILSGTADSKKLFIYSSDTSSVIQTGGSLSVSEKVYLGLTSGSSGAYNLSGSGQLTAGTLALGHAAGGEGYFTQTAGNVNVGLLEFVWSSSNTYDLSGTGVLNAGDLNMEAGTMRQSGDTTTVVSNDFTVAGTYYLEGAGQLTAKRQYINYYGVLEHSGGSNTITEVLYLGYDGYYSSGTYRLSGDAALNTPVMFVGWGDSGIFQQSGGTATIGRLHVNSRSKIDLSEGTLQINECLTVVNILDFTGSAGMLRIGDNVAANLSHATINNVSNGAIIGGTDSLIIFPAGFDTSSLGQYITAGRTHISGSGNLCISPGENYTISGKIDDHVICEGSLIAPEGTSLDLNSGLEASSGGTVNLGDTGQLTVEDHVSGISSGLIRALVVVGTPNAPGTFKQGGGTVEGRLSVGSNGRYELSGMGTLNISGFGIGGSSGTGTFVQESGVINLTGSIYIAERGQGLYEMKGGVLNVADRLRLSGYGGVADFTQTGGTVNVDNGILVSSNGTYTLNNGTIKAYWENIRGRFQQSSGNNSVQWLDIRTGGRFEYTGGTLSIGGWTIDGEWDFTGKTATVQAMDGAVLDFRLIGSGTIKNAENISFVAGTNSLTIIEPGFDPGSLFGNYTTTGLVHTVGDTLEVPSGVSLVFSHIDSNDTLDFDDHVRCSGSITVGGDSYYKGVDLNDGLEISNGGIVDLGKGHVIVNDLVSGISSGQLNNRNYGWLRVGKMQEGKFTQTGGTVNVGTISLGSHDATGSYEMQHGQINASTMYVGLHGRGSFVHEGGVIDTNSLTVAKDSGTLSGAPICTYRLETNATLTTNETTLGHAGKGHFTHNDGTHTTNTLTVGEVGTNSCRYDLKGGQLSAVNEILEWGDLYQTGGKNVVTGELYVSLGGSYYLSNGELEATVERIEWYKFSQSGGSNTISEKLTVGCTYDGRYELSSGTLWAENITIGEHFTHGYFIQSGGTNTVNSTLRLGEINQAHGTYELQAGNLIAHTVEVGYGYIQYPGNTGVFNHTGGTNTISGNLFLGYNAGASGTYTIGNANLGVSNFYVGYDGSGTLNITDAVADVTVSSLLQFGADSAFTAVPGSTIHMTGSAFENQSTNPDNLAGLGNLTLIFEGGSGVVDPFEVAGEDMGAVLAGLDSNFALGTLQLGGDDIGQVVLLDRYDNQTGWEGVEAQYLQNLIVNPGSTLYLNGINLYVNGVLVNTGEGDQYGGGTISSVPEPTTMLLLALGALAMLKRSRKSRT